MTGAPIAELAWDSAFFGFSIARVTCSDPGPREMDNAFAACQERGVRCLYLLVGADDERTSLLAQERGFRLHDVRMELDRALDVADRQPMPIGVAPVNPKQHSVLEGLARECFEVSRFFADPRFDDERARELYVAFLQRGLSSPERITLADDGARGFVICHLQPQRDVGAIELICVAACARGTGVSASLMQAAHETFAAAGLSRAEVVTQARNVGAQRLYQGMGYRTCRVGFWFHRWFD